MKLSTSTNAPAIFSMSKVDDVVTMSSLEMVSYINSTRKPGEAEVRHDNFMTKVEKVLGILAPKFLGTSSYTNGAGNKVGRKIYNFPKREATLMAMSFSFPLQAAVLDAWTAAEATLINNDIKPPVISALAFPDPNNHMEMVKAWVAEKELTLVLTNEMKLAQPKIAFHDAVVANDKTYSLAEGAKILGFPPRTFNKILRAEGYLMADNVAYQPYITNNVFMLRYSGFVHADGTVAPATTKITSKGIAFLQKRLVA